MGGGQGQAKQEPSAPGFVLCAVEDVGGFLRWESADWGFRHTVWEAIRKEEAPD